MGSKSWYGSGEMQPVTEIGQHQKDLGGFLRVHFSICNSLFSWELGKLPRYRTSSGEERAFLSRQGKGAKPGQVRHNIARPGLGVGGGGDLADH